MGNEKISSGYFTQSRAGCKYHSMNQQNVCRFCFTDNINMPTECPMVPLDSRQKSAVKNGNIDFVNKTWQEVTGGAMWYSL